jgi:hypothetical protein
MAVRAGLVAQRDVHLLLGSIVPRRHEEHVGMSTVPPPTSAGTRSSRRHPPPPSTTQHLLLFRSKTTTTERVGDALRNSWVVV